MTSWIAASLACAAANLMLLQEVIAFKFFEASRACTIVDASTLIFALHDP